MKKKCYILGPMRGYPKHNFPAFDEAAIKLKEKGYIPINPAEMDRLYEGWEDYPPEGFSEEINKETLKRFILRDIVALMECECYHCLPGWPASKGALVEKFLSEFLLMERVEFDD